MRWYTALPITAAVLLAAACADQPTSVAGLNPAGPRLALASAGPTLIAGNPTCSDLITGAKEIKIDGVPTAGQTYGPVTITTVYGTSPDQYGIDFTSVIPILGVVMKGSNAGNFYDYRPDGVLGDTHLVTPINASGKNAAISHISFCYVPKLVVTKTANTTFDRDWDWTINKSNNSGSTETSPLRLRKGESFVVTYTVSGGATSTDFNFGVSGTITVSNPLYNGASAKITSVTDVISLSGQSDIAGVVVCPVTFPHVLAAGDSFKCTYSASLPNNSARTNTATANVDPTSEVKAGSGTAAVTFGSTPTNEFDKCITITDNLVTSVSKKICVGDLVNGTYKFTYTYDVKDYPKLVCDQTTKIHNVASFATGDNDEGNDTGWASSDVWVRLICEQGCTLTQGYWKTHSAAGPAPYDSHWITTLTPQGGSTPFYLSGKTWLQVLQTPPRGNAYYILAVQYIAASLNSLNGASTTVAVDAALAGAKTFFATHTPTSVLTTDERNQLLAWATTLDQYNNGLIGPGHCSEQTK